jgi:cholera toxin transcriptional activator
MENVAKGNAAIRFGDFELDYSEELRCQGRKIKLQEQPLQILRILIEHPGKIVSREELQKRIWPSGTFVVRFSTTRQLETQP